MGVERRGGVGKIGGKLRKCGGNRKRRLSEKGYVGKGEVREDCQISGGGRERGKTDIEGVRIESVGDGVGGDLLIRGGGSKRRGDMNREVGGRMQRQGRCPLSHKLLACTCLFISIFLFVKMKMTYLSRCFVSYLFNYISVLGPTIFHS